MGFVLILIFGAYSFFALYFMGDGPRNSRVEKWLRYIYPATVGGLPLAFAVVGLIIERPINKYEWIHHGGTVHSLCIVLFLPLFTTGTYVASLTMIRFIQSAMPSGGGVASNEPRPSAAMGILKFALLILSWIPNPIIQVAGGFFSVAVLFADNGRDALSFASFVFWAMAAFMGLTYLLISLILLPIGIHNRRDSPPPPESP